MSESERDGRAADLAGGAEGGMASGSAGGPSQAEAEKRTGKGVPFAEKTPSTDVESKVGDLGQGSHEQTQGKTRPDEP